MDYAIFALLLLIAAATLVAIGLAGVTERLPRNRWLGLRVKTIRDGDEAWRAGHRAAGPALIAAAGPPLLLGVALLVSPPDEVADWIVAYAVVGVVTGGLIALSTRRAENALQGPGSDD